MRLAGRPHNTTPTGSIPNAYYGTSAFQTCSVGPFHCSRKCSYKQQSDVLFVHHSTCSVLYSVALAIIEQAIKENGSSADKVLVTD